MPIINSEIKSQKSLQCLNQIPLTGHTTKISNQMPNLYLGPKNMQVPAVTNLLFAPFELGNQIRAVSDACQIHDVEGIFDNTLRCIQSPASISNSALQISGYVLYASTFFEWINEKIAFFSQPILHAIAALGLVLCTIEFIFESINLFRAILFFNEFFPSSLPENPASKEKIYLLHLTKLWNSYFQVSSDQISSPQEIQDHLQVKKNDLTRRVQPWLATQIEDSVPEILIDLQSENQEVRDQASQKAASIFNNIRIQAQKKWIIHSIGLIALALLIAGIIAGFCICPYLIPILLLGIGTGLSWARNYFSLGYLDSEGWNFSIDNCLPDMIKNLGKAQESYPTLQSSEFKFSYSYSSLQNRRNMRPSHYSKIAIFDEFFCRF